MIFNNNFRITNYLLSSWKRVVDSALNNILWANVTNHNFHWSISPNYCKTVVATESTSDLTLQMLRRKGIWKPSQPCHVGIHWKAPANNSQIRIHVPVFQWFFSFFASFYIWRIGHQQHKGQRIYSWSNPMDNRWWNSQWMDWQLGIAAQPFWLKMKNNYSCIQYIHLIPAPVLRTAGIVWLYKHPWITCLEYKQNTSKTHVAFESHLSLVVRSSMPPYLGNWVAIGRAVVWYDRAAHAHSGGFKCWHSSCK